MANAGASRAPSATPSPKAILRRKGQRSCPRDLRFGMGMDSSRVSTPDRRDRLWLLNALAIALLTLLGAAGEALGYDRHLKSNTTKRRTHSLLRQGCLLYNLIPTMPELRLLPLVERFAAMLAKLPVSADASGPI